MEKRTKNIIITISSIAACVIIGLIIFLLVKSMNGETTYTKTDVDSVNSQILACNSATKAYPFFKYDNSDKKDLKIDVRFTNNTLQAISLKYTLYYNNPEEISKSSAHNHAAMDLSFYANGLDANEFDAYYSELSDSMRMTLYVTKGDFTRTAAKYFMINLSDSDQIPSTISEFQNLYKVSGLKCEKNNN